MFLLGTGSRRRGLSSRGTSAASSSLRRRGGSARSTTSGIWRSIPEFSKWLARSFARATGPTSGVKRFRAAEGLWGEVQRFAGYLGKVNPPVHQPAHITAAHIKESLLAVPLGSRKTHVHRMRAIFRADRELTAETRSAILHGRLPAYESKVQPYSHDEYQELMTAVRHDIRVARDRIYEGRELLAAYRRGELGLPNRRNQFEKAGRVLDLLDRTGDLPRRVTSSSPQGGIPAWVGALGGAHDLVSRLALTRSETVAFCLMLVDLTSENLGTIGEWPAAHFRPDGDLGGPAAGSGGRGQAASRAVIGVHGDAAGGPTSVACRRVAGRGSRQAPVSLAFACLSTPPGSNGIRATSQWWHPRRLLSERPGPARFGMGAWYVAEQSRGLGNRTWVPSSEEGGKRAGSGR